MATLAETSTVASAPWLLPLAPDLGQAQSSQQRHREAQPMIRKQKVPLGPAAARSPPPARSFRARPISNAYK